MVRAPFEETALGITALLLAHVVHGIHIRNHDTVHILHGLANLNLVSPAVHYEGEAVELLALRGHLLGKYRPDNNLHFHDSPKLTFR